MKTQQRLSRRLLLAASALALASSLIGGAAWAAPSVDRSRPPAPETPKPWRADSPVRFTLKNGLEVLLVERHQVPLVDVVVQVRSGASHDPLDLPGAASWTSAMLTEGAGERGALAFADAVEFLGASLAADAGWEGSRVMLHVPSARLDEGLGLLADATLRPSFPEEEWVRLREKKRTEFLQWRDSPYALSQLARDRALWGAHRYALPRSGTPASLEKVKLADLKELHRTRYTVDNAFVVVVGDVTRAEAERLLEKHFGAWKKAPEGFRPPAWRKPPFPSGGPRLILVDKPNAPQSLVAVAARTPDGLEELDPGVEVMNTLLGGSFTSRLNQNLREENQFSYGARSSFDLREHGNAFLALAAVATPVTAPATAEMLKELRLIRSYVEDSEAERARGYLALTFPTTFETGGAVASFWAWAYAKGVPPSRVERFPERALAQSERDLLLAARKSLPLDQLRIVVVGDRAVVEPELKKLGLGPLEVWTAEELLTNPL